MDLCSNDLFTIYFFFTTDEIICYINKTNNKSLNVRFIFLQNYNTSYEKVDISVECGGVSPPKYRPQRKEYDIFYYYFIVFFNVNINF